MSSSKKRNFLNCLTTVVSRVVLSFVLPLSALASGQIEVNPYIDQMGLDRSEFTGVTFEIIDTIEGDKTVIFYSNFSESLMHKF